MKLSIAIQKALDAHKLASKLMKPYDDKLAELLDDYSAHFCVQASDGMVIAWGNGLNNSGVFLIDNLDDILSMSKDDLLEILEETSI